MVDAISILMFSTPMMIGLTFTLLSYIALKEKQADVVGFFSSLMSAICWFIFSLTWSGIATEEMFQNVSYLWMAMGTIFSVITLYIGMKMMLAIFKEKPTRPLMQMVREY
jgi:signal transduction histidine kinase